MRAMVLAAGRGERMRPLTDATPKPLLQVGGRALIDYHLDKLVRAGFRDVVINVSWRAEDIVSHVGDGSRFGMHVQWSHESRALETGGGIAHARELLSNGTDDKGWFALVSADVFADYDFAHLATLGASLDAQTRAKLVLVPHHADLRGEYCLAGDRLKMVEADHAPGETFTWASMGVFQTALFDGLPTDEPFALLPLFRSWTAEGLMGGEVFTGLWENLGNPEQLRALQVTRGG